MSFSAEAFLIYRRKYLSHLLILNIDLLDIPENL